MKKQKGFSLIGVLLVVGVLLLTAGGVVALPAVRQVWEKKIPKTPSPVPITNPTTSPIEPPFTKPTEPSVGKPKVGQECTYDYECSKLGWCTQSWPPNCWIGKCVEGHCVLEKVPQTTGTIPVDWFDCTSNADCILSSCLLPADSSQQCSIGINARFKALATSMFCPNEAPSINWVNENECNITVEEMLGCGLPSSVWCNGGKCAASHCEE